MKKISKIFLLVSSVLIANTSIASALTSCSFKETINDIGNLDKQYGISMATYSRMESDFSDLYEAKEMEELNNGAISEQQYKANLLNFKSGLNSFHATLFNKDNKSLSYTIKTNTLRDFARKNYGIRLSRVTNINLNDELVQLKNSLLNSLLIYIKEYNVSNDDANKLLTNADNSFDSIVLEAKLKFGVDDVVSIVQYVQEHMVSCFNGITKEMDAIITQRQLKDFFEDYEISVKENITNNYCWDTLYSTYGGGEWEITVDYFNNIFNVFKEKPIVSSSNSISTKLIKFTNDIIPGYTLKPILHKMISNPYTNIYSIDVDYTLVNNQYVNDVDAAKLIVHSAALKNKSLYEDDNIDVFALNDSKENREYTNYQLPITKKYEEQQIDNTYFNDKDFTFSWSTSNEYGFDDFWVQPNEFGQNSGKLSKSKLATTGMMINGYLLSDILYQAEKVCLYNGSTSLNGEEKKQGNDAQQWKLMIDNEEINNDNVKWELTSATNQSIPNSISIKNGIISWNNNIIAGKYSFYVIANCKELKIQSPIITLSIAGQTQNANNINYFLNKVYSNDKNIIDQKLIDFVNNVQFYLNYNEIDYDKVDEANNKGQIKINSFVIRYQNSNNEFNVSKQVIDVIDNAINNESGITKRYSESLWERIKESYNAVVSTIQVDRMINEIQSELDNLKSVEITYSVLLSSFTLIITILFIASLLVINNCNSFMGQMSCKGSFESFKKVFIVIPYVVMVLGLIIGIVSVIIRMEIPRSDLNNKLNELETGSKKYKIIMNINNDAKYFANADGKINFNTLTTAEIKNKKSYYELGYKQQKLNESTNKKESDLEEYFGGQENITDILNNLDNIIESFKWLHILTASFVLLTLWYVFIIIGVIGINQLDIRRADDLSKAAIGVKNKFDHNKWLKSKGILQFCANLFNKIKGLYSARWMNMHPEFISSL